MLRGPIVGALSLLMALEVGPSRAKLGGTAPMRAAGASRPITSRPTPLDIDGNTTTLPARGVRMTGVREAVGS
jgi:hypothetical protein